jgi:hypothetical protein
MKTTKLIHCTPLLYRVVYRNYIIDDNALNVLVQSRQKNLFTNILQKYVAGLAEDQLRHCLVRLLVQSKSSFPLLQAFAHLPAGRLISDGDHPFAPPINKVKPGWCVCDRCTEMPTARENVCCRHRECRTTQEYFRATVLDPDILQLQIRYHADVFNLRLDYSPSVYRKAAYRQYVLGQYGLSWTRKQGSCPILCC